MLNQFVLKALEMFFRKIERFVDQIEAGFLRGHPPFFIVPGYREVRIPFGHVRSWKRDSACDVSFMMDFPSCSLECQANYGKNRGFVARLDRYNSLTIRACLPF